MTIICEVTAIAAAVITAVAECRRFQQVLDPTLLVTMDDYVGNIVKNIEDRLPASNLWGSDGKGRFRIWVAAVSVVAVQPLVSN